MATMCLYTGHIRSPDDIVPRGWSPQANITLGEPLWPWGTQSPCYNL